MAPSRKEIISAIGAEILAQLGRGDVSAFTGDWHTKTASIPLTPLGGSLGSCLLHLTDRTAFRCENEADVVAQSVMEEIIGRVALYEGVPLEAVQDILAMGDDLARDMGHKVAAWDYSDQQCPYCHNKGIRTNGDNVECTTCGAAWGVPSATVFDEMKPKSSQTDETCPWCGADACDAYENQGNGILTCDKCKGTWKEDDGKISPPPSGEFADNSEHTALSAQDLSELDKLKNGICPECDTHTAYPFSEHNASSIWVCPKCQAAYGFRGLTAQVDEVEKCEVCSEPATCRLLDPPYTVWCESHVPDDYEEMADDEPKTAQVTRLPIHKGDMLIIMLANRQEYEARALADSKVTSFMNGSTEEGVPVEILSNGLVYTVLTEYVTKVNGVPNMSAQEAFYDDYLVTGANASFCSVCGTAKIKSNISGKMECPNKAEHPKKSAQSAPMLTPFTNESQRWRTDNKGKALPLYTVSVDGEVIGLVGQYMATGHHKGIRPNSSTGSIKRWGCTLLTEGKTLERMSISTLGYGNTSRAEAIEGLLWLYNENRKTSQVEGLFTYEVLTQLGAGAQSQRCFVYYDFHEDESNVVRVMSAGTIFLTTLTDVQVALDDAGVLFADKDDMTVTFVLGGKTASVKCPSCGSTATREVYEGEDGARSEYRCSACKKTFDPDSPRH